MVSTDSLIARTRSLLEIITAAYQATGKRGKPSASFVRQWRERNPAYGCYPLWVRFYSGSALPCRGRTKLDRATAAWIAAGNPPPSSPAYNADEFAEYMAAFRDDYEALEDCSA